MIELLSRLDAAGSAVIAQMQDTGRREGEAERERVRKVAQSRRCGSCEGRGGAEVLKVWHWCRRCGGSGESLPAAGKETRSRTAPKGMTAEAVIGLTVGVPSYWLDAAMVRVRKDADAAQRLHGEVLTRLVLPTAQVWKMDDEDRERRASVMASLAVAQIPMSESKGAEQGPGDVEFWDGRITAGEAAKALGITRRTWQSTWRDRHDAIVYGIESWISACDSRMYRNHRDGFAEEAA